IQLGLVQLDDRTETQIIAGLRQAQRAVGLIEQSCCYIQRRKAFVALNQATLISRAMRISRSRVSCAAAWARSSASVQDRDVYVDRSSAFRPGGPSPGLHGICQAARSDTGPA